MDKKFYYDIEKDLLNKKFQLKLKRIFDILFSIIGIILIFPFFIIIGILIKLDSKGPILFKQIRVGKDEKKFKILKFRTMISDAEMKGLKITTGNDSRITKIGTFLRKYKIDEFPQLFNVLKGDMSFVGPRPEVPIYVEKYSYNQKVIFKIRPGITDLSSIKYRDESKILMNSSNPEKKYIEEIMPEKIKLNIIYLKNISLINDLKLIIETLIRIIKY